ncbi:MULTISPECIES: hypothetical protein [unclassified Nostoc]|uniref:hypothetical protein n=1 Tax=unclassified Nostoc TaxID=2593658 RepID=UPI002AD3BAC6|nr:hypothetical protein [Nostoc sp. DedQUE03]MDZ7976269.1 hypothetical protein [Nostoc sp. DedQUE03]MDZ8044930.1 hypothetical protein [Nostoc sp. DedQUE02]
MISPPNNPNSDDSQSDPLTFLSMVINREDGREILNKSVEFLARISYIQQDRAEAVRQKRAEAEAQQKIETEAKACKILMAITIEHAKAQGLDPYKDLDKLQSKSYNQLCAYVKQRFPELSNRIPLYPG